MRSTRSTCDDVDVGNAAHQATLDVEPAAGSLGAFVTGLDLTTELDAGDARRVARRDPRPPRRVPARPADDARRPRAPHRSARRSRRDAVRQAARRPTVRDPRHQGARRRAELRQRLAHRPVVPSRAAVVHAAARPRRPRPRRRHRLGQPVPRVRDAVARPARRRCVELDAVHSAGATYGTGGYLDSVKGKSSMAIEPSKEAFRQHVHPVVTRHPETGPRGPVRQLRLHDPHRRLVEHRERRAARPPPPPCRQRELHLPARDGSRTCWRSGTTGARSTTR